MAGKLFQNAIALIVLGWVASTASAQDTLLSELYGQGVHSYFAGDAEKAHQMLSLAIEQGSRDPRCFYFRGLAYHKLGRPEEGGEDFKRGAELEAAGEAVQIDIGSALQRIQGPTRMELEDFRYQARLTAAVVDVKQRQQRYEEFRQDEQRVIRRPDAGADVKLPITPAPDPDDPFGGAAEAPGVAVPPTEPAVAQPAEPADMADPFADPDEPIVVPPADSAPAPGDDPFGAPAAPAPMPGDDPFGAPAAPAPMPGDDPFGEPAAPAPMPDDDPFGAPAAPAPMPADDSFGAPAAPAPMPADDDDLLGGDDPFASPPGPDPGMEEEDGAILPGDEDNPFADDPPEDAAADDDPFGS